MDSTTTSITSSAIVEDDEISVFRALHLHVSDVPPDLSLTPWEISSLTDVQEKAISLLPLIPGLMSILGSSIIIYMAVKRGRNQSRSKKKRWTPYTRLLFAMSCYDIISSAALMMTPFLLPAASSQRVWAFGNDSTCTAMGFFQQLQGSALLYNGFLSFYFVLTARFGWKNDQLARTVEPFMHILSIGFPLATATTGAIMGIYHENELGQSCWIANYPENCDLDGDYSDCQAVTLAWIFGGPVMLFSLLSIPINNMIIFLFVRRQTVSSENRRRRKQPRLKTTTTTTTTQDGNSSDIPNNSFRRSIKVDSFSISMASDDAYSDANSNSERKEQRRQTRTMNDSSSRRQDLQLQRLQLVSSQAFLYVGAFFICTIWSFALKILEISYNSEDEDDLYALLLLQAWFFPLQGFLNVFIYIRPKYMKHRQEFPDESRLWAFRRSVHGEDEILPSSKSNPDRGGPPKNNDTTGRQEQARVSSLAAKKQFIELETPLNDNGNDGIQQRREQRDEVETSAPSSRPLPRNNVSSITCEDLDESSSEFEATVSVEMNNEWRWMSGNKPPRRKKSSGSGTSSLEAISELSAISFVDPEDEVYEESSSSSDGSSNDTLPDDSDHSYLDAKSVKSAPAYSSDRRVRFLGEDDQLTQTRRRWSIGNTASGSSGAIADKKLQEFQTSNQQGLVAFVRYYMFAHTTTSADDDDDSSSSSSSGSLDPSFDRMESINTPPSRDAPVQRPTRRLSPAYLEIPASVV
jgi:hypothetical protein